MREHIESQPEAVQTVLWMHMLMSAFGDDLLEVGYDTPHFDRYASVALRWWDGFTGVYCSAYRNESELAEECIRTMRNEPALASILQTNEL